MNDILIIDDNSSNLKLLRVLLQGEGFKVRTASDAGQALALLASERPDLILTDIQLPDMDGLELTRRVKADPATQGIPIVAVTAYAMSSDRDKALAAGCDAYISKPIDTRQLPALLQGLLGGSRG